MARIPKQRVIFDAEKYDLDYLRETRDSYSPITHVGMNRRASGTTFTRPGTPAST